MIQNISASPGSPGPRGLQGGVTRATVVSGNLSAFKAVTWGSQVQPYNGTRPNGVALADTNVGSTADIQTSGPLIGANLGAGLACAVGCKSDGTLCRVGDSGWQSDLQIIGDCDTLGNIVLAPRRAHFYDVRDFGAVGDGITDDTAAIQAAFNATSANGGSVFFPPGKYKTTGTLTLPLVGASKATKIFGAGQGASYIISAHAGTCIKHAGNPLVTSYGLTRISDLSLWTTANGFAGYWSVGLAYEHLDHVQIGNADGLGTVGFQYGVIFDGSETCSISNSDFERNTIGQIFLTNGPELTPSMVSGSTNIFSFIGCQFDGGQYGIIDSGGALRNIIACNFNANTVHAMYLAGVQLMHVTGCDFESTAIFLTYQTFIGASNTGGCGEILFSECSSIRFNIVSGNLTLERNILVGTPPITGGQNAYRIIDRDNVYSGTLYDNPPTTGNFKASGGPDATRKLTGTVAPTTGSWSVGDIVFNTIPSAGGVWAWVCTTAGSPGTWKTINIGA